MSKNSFYTKLIFASTNSGKVREVQNFLKYTHIELTSLNSLTRAPFPEVKEDGNTFQENALIKARFYFDLIREPIIADDSGLIVPELNGEPGIFSARYAGDNASDDDNNALLLKKLKFIPPEKRQALFKAVVVYKDQYIEKIFEGHCKGTILESPIGKNGFGYDPIFLLRELGKTFAELEPAQKNIYSHRGKAIKKLISFLKSKEKQLFFN